MNSPALLSLSGLTIEYASRGEVIRDVSFDIGAGEVVALVGQSGSGKSTIARAVQGLLPGNGRVTAGDILVNGHVVTQLPQRRWRTLRGSTVGFVPQDPLGSLDPLKPVGDQIAEVLRVHRITDRAGARRRAVELLEHVGIADASRRSGDYPHQLSGGQLQRVLIAIAIAGEPRLLIADEPTSALDVTVQRRILELLDELRVEHGLGVLFITHDLALAEQHSDTVVVLCDGEVRETGPTASVLSTPKDEYTRQLIAAAPALAPDKYAHRPTAAATAEPILRVDRLVKRYGETRALDTVSFDVRTGSIHALVGESGSGKTTAARVLAGLTDFDSGEVRVNGSLRAAQSPLGAAQQRAQARILQLVHQNPLAALDPRFTIGEAIAEPLRINRIGSPAQRRHEVGEVLDRVGLPAGLADRKPREISGGQRQRVGLARALVLHPAILVLDEPTSALDVHVQAQVVDLLIDLQQELELTYLFISHDLSLVRQIADHVSVLEHGRLVETGATADIFAAPSAAYTRRLLDAVPGVPARAA
ncbi:dipeptide ABC transporter ATP-binding protein [Mycolicibacterium neworleansense]|uniref:Dipeptide-transport ATP-binding protein ABC transporter DPPD n=1 Tax=Mycolicibacterium neworleansense TaxID=146018 RepID=A0A0H5S1A0_9MYCO|nr:ABC transporter ATP-binding protein [Mycolicibacterium neworleansense]MCV7363877.1 ABC transporter ATP-binding protein [Mycolicibacterium neworleansense]CRZ14784.1 dipeptide-transport ATP-binding protein ABC transporter DPPD [Mycolicibacterium neworleansense]